MNLTVEKIMASPVVTTTIGSTTGYVRELMERKQVSAIPIVQLDGEKIHLKGIVTTSDLRGIEDESTGVDIIMTRSLKSVEKQTPVKDAAKLMIEKDLHHLVVIENDKIVGIVSSIDFVKIIAKG
jgi:CBS domain-containing protein